VANEEENAYSLTNVLFETEKRNERSYIRMISSDGHRLSIMEKDVATDIDLLNIQPGTLITQKKVLQEIKKNSVITVTLLKYLLKKNNL